MKKILGMFFASVIYTSTIFGLSVECQTKIDKYDVDMKMSPENVNCILSGMSEEVNKQTPITVDNVTVLLNTVALDDTLMYRYEVSLKLTKDNIPGIREKMRIMNQNVACDIDIIRDIFKNNGHLKYAYYDKNMNKYFDFTISSCPK